jgi:diazepam-binding inhibitor (GABA receptor modulating acyl-CoA-binding protein)
MGDNTTAKPGMLDFKGKAKWEAWTANKGILCFTGLQSGMSKEEAQQKYIQFVKELSTKE